MNFSNSTSVRHQSASSSLATYLVIFQRWQQKRMDNGQERVRSGQWGPSLPLSLFLPLCGVALIIHVSINCHFVVIVVHTPFFRDSLSPSFFLSVNTLTSGGGDGALPSGRIALSHLEVPQRISSFFLRFTLDD